MTEGELEKQMLTTLDGYIDRDDGDFWKVQDNIQRILDEAAKEFPSFTVILNEGLYEANDEASWGEFKTKAEVWFKKWFGIEKP